MLAGAEAQGLRSESAEAPGVGVVSLLVLQSFDFAPVRSE